MNAREKEKFERIDEKLKPIARKLLKLQLSEIPADPEVNKWYRYRPEGFYCASGEPYYGLYKVGKESKLMIIFGGGGVSIDDFTAARPNSIYHPEPLTFYFNDVFMLADYMTYNGLPVVRDDNPFKDWSMILVPYTTGDFHTGTRIHQYHDDELGDGIVYHHGHINLHMLIDGFRKYLKNPEKILVTGFSAGGFATALLTDDILDCYPDCRDATAVVDSALLLYDGWHDTAKNQWGSPKAIYERLVSNNLTLDSLLALHKKRPEVKILFISSTKDAALALYQSFIDRKEMAVTAEDGEKYYRALQQTCDTLLKQIPAIGIYLFDDVVKETPYVTKHTIILDPLSYSMKSDGKNVFEWMYESANGNVEKLGMKLLEK